MNYNDQPKHRTRVILIALFCLLVVAAIIYLKSANPGGKNLQPAGSPEDSATQMAVPDTTADPAVIPAPADTVEYSVLPDTLLGKDKRNPYEAGYEDGYAAGCDDGAAHTDHATYDESSSFATAKEREAYTNGYREGYAKGYDDGMQGKQFNISGVPAK